METQQQIDERSKLLTNFDDSSDEEDNYEDLKDENGILEHYKKVNSNLASQHLETALTLENEGRRLIYNPINRKRYYENKKRFLKNKNINFDTVDASSLINNVIQNILANSIQLQQQEMENLQVQINQQLQNTSQLTNLKSLVFKQLNRSDILPEFRNVLEPIIKKIIEKNKTNFLNKEMQLLTKQYTLTSDKILEIEIIKKALQDEIVDKLKSLKNQYQQANQDQKPDRTITIGNYDWNIDKMSKSLDEYIRDKDKKLNGNALNAFIKNVLNSEIEEYLEKGFLDKKKQNYDSSWLKAIENLATQNNIQSIMSCNFSLLDKEKNKLLTGSESYDYAFDMVRQQFLKNLQTELQNFSAIERKTLKTTYIDSNPIANTSDFYGKEHLLYRSATRQSRNNKEKEVARTMVFDDEQDLSVQKKQEMKAQNKASQNHITNRGTIQEEVYNLGNYESVLEKIRSLNTSDSNIAGRIRRVFKYGSQTLDNITTQQGQKVILTNQQKQIIIELTELFFGTEGFRSPATIIETNMALDLIMQNKATWQDLLMGNNNIGKGGNLSYTMKSSAGAGGIECGRRLSEDVNIYHQRKHKYGGEPIGKNSEGYKEYLSRKYNITNEWKNLQNQPGKNLKTLIREKDKTWYSF